jgi:hypothetical protein
MLLNPGLMPGASSWMVGASWCERTVARLGLGAKVTKTGRGAATSMRPEEDEAGREDEAGGVAAALVPMLACRCPTALRHLTLA